MSGATVLSLSCVHRSSLSAPCLAGEDVAKYKGRYDAGYGEIQKVRYQRMVDLQLLDPTLILFASDNGACAEESGAHIKSDDIDEFGKVGSYETVGQNWATVQNTPMRYWKNYSHEGGINTPFIVSWPEKIKEVGGFYREPAHFIDVMPTLVDLSGATYPVTFNGQVITPMQGTSLLLAFEKQPLARENPLFWQWKKGGAVRVGAIKAVFFSGKWELFDFSKDRNESNDLSAKYPEQLQRMKRMWTEWYHSADAGK